MADAPTGIFIADVRAKITGDGVYGICLRGKAGWGENMAFLTATANSFRRALVSTRNGKPHSISRNGRTRRLYVKRMRRRPSGRFLQRLNENLALFNSGKCGMWIDATVAASFVTNPKESKVADKVGFALARTTASASAANWLWCGRWRCGGLAED